MSALEWTESDVRCPSKDCGHVFESLHWHQLNGIKSLMLNGAKVFTLTMICPSCGEPFHWNYSIAEMKKQTSIYLRLLSLLYGEHGTV